jgi:hypothetical protein
MHSVGFEPTPPKRTELESVALDHSAMNAIFIIIIIIIIKPTTRIELATLCLRNRCNNHYATLAYFIILLFY